MVDSKVCH